MRSITRTLVLVGLASSMLTACDSGNRVTPAGPAPVVVAPEDGTGVSSSANKDPVTPPDPAPGTCTTWISGAYTCTKCTSKGGFVVVTTCVPTATPHPTVMG
jgi:hypothetical protein